MSATANSGVSLDLNVDDPILRIPDVERSIGLKKSTIYAMIQRGEFPEPLRLGPRASGWLLSSINQWKRDRIEESHGKAKQ